VNSQVVRFFALITLSQVSGNPVAGIVDEHIDWLLRIPQTLDYSLALRLDVKISSENLRLDTPLMGDSVCQTFQT
jgi:hypothetical protein